MNSQSDNHPIVTRFAPSPTGFMHVGSLRTALYAWLWARKNNGTFILRIEDTDKEREVEGSIEHIKKSLMWLGLEWDFGPDKPGPVDSYIQSERLEVYKKYAQILIEKGHAYTDPFTEEEVEALRQKAEEEKRPFLYREHRKETAEIWDGTKPLRFKVPMLKRYEWKDAVWGDLSAGEEALDDFILIKSDGYPTYNFAHIVDDIEMNVTHVMRGQEFISSTPKFLSLYDAFELTPPIFATLPPIMAPDGKKKLSKRDGAKDILEYKKEGILPDALVNFLALLGWNPGTDQEIFTREELVQAFDISKIQHSGAGLNEVKLNWINKEHMKKLEPSIRNKEIIQKLYSANLPNLSKLEDKEFSWKICYIISERIEKWSDIEILIETGDIGYLFEALPFEKHILFTKNPKTDDNDPEKIKNRLKKVQELLNSAPQNLFDHSEGVKQILWEYANTEGRGQVLWPTRVALSGREKSPDPFTLISLLGKEESIARIKNAIKILG